MSLLGVIGVGICMTLGELIDALGAQDPNAPVRWDRERKHYYGGAGKYPGNFHSWRGDYAALTLDKSDQAPLVSTLLLRAKGALNADFEGWKGGTYRMVAETPVWAENWGDCDDIALTGVSSGRDGYIVLRTRKVAV